MRRNCRLFALLLLLFLFLFTSILVGLLILVFLCFGFLIAAFCACACAGGDIGRVKDKKSTGGGDDYRVLLLDDARHSENLGNFLSLSLPKPI